MNNLNIVFALLFIGAIFMSCDRKEICIERIEVNPRDGLRPGDIIEIRQITNNDKIYFDFDTLEDELTINGVPVNIIQQNGNSLQIGIPELKGSYNAILEGEFKINGKTDKEDCGKFSFTVSYKPEIILKDKKGKCGEIITLTGDFIQSLDIGDYEIRFFNSSVEGDIISIDETGDGREMKVMIPKNESLTHLRTPIMVSLNNYGIPLSTADTFLYQYTYISKAIIGERKNAGCTIGTVQETRLGTINGIEVDDIGNIYAADSENNVIWKFDYNNSYESTIFSSSCENMPAICSFDDFDRNTTSNGSQARYNKPNFITIKGNESIYLTEQEPGFITLRSISSNGNIVRTISGKCDSIPSTSNTIIRDQADVIWGVLEGIAIDASGDIYLADDYFNAIYKLKDGKSELFIGSGTVSAPGCTPNANDFATTKFSMPKDIGLDDLNKPTQLFVVDQACNCIKLISLVEDKVNSVSLDGFLNNVRGLAYDGKGHLFICDETANEIYSIDIAKKKLF